MFSLECQEQIHLIEADHNLESGSIVSASWIKRPELCSPNQKTANVKFLCSSPTVANKLLTEKVFIANTRVIITKDAHEPIHCNKCQVYGHIHICCPNDERCTTCARSHPTASCSFPNDHHCVSCSTASNHSSSDRSNCPQFEKHQAGLNACSLENTLLCFPILRSPWLFILAVKNPNSTTAPSQCSGQPNSTPAVRNNT